MTAGDLAMFGELEDAPEDRLVVRAAGHVLGTSEGWLHWSGMAVIFPAFRTEHPKLVDLVSGIPAKKIALGIDFYTGEVKIIEAAQNTTPKVHHALQLQDLLGD